MSTVHVLTDRDGENICNVQTVSDEKVKQWDCIYM